MMNNLKRNAGGDGNGIIEIKNESILNICKNTTNEKKWKRKCPNCQRDLFYKDKYILNSSKKKNTICNKCSRAKQIIKFEFKYENECTICRNKFKYKTKPKTVASKWVCNKCKRKYKSDGSVYKRSCPDCKKELKYENKWTFLRAVKNKSACGRCRQLGKKHYIPYRTPHSEKTIQKIRLAHLKRIEDTKFNGGQMIPNYNRIACEYFDWLNKWNGWNGKHAMNGGELFLDKLGYWVDYYEPVYNIVVEWDEKKHFNADGTLKEKDVNRMSEIKDHLRCRFFRVNDKTRELKEW